MRVAVFDVETHKHAASFLVPCSFPKKLPGYPHLKNSKQIDTLRKFSRNLALISSKKRQGPFRFCLRADLELCSKTVGVNKSKEAGPQACFECMKNEKTSLKSLVST